MPSWQPVTLDMPFYLLKLHVSHVCKEDILPGRHSTARKIERVNSYTDFSDRYIRSVRPFMIMVFVNNGGKRIVGWTTLSEGGSFHGM